MFIRKTKVKNKSTGNSGYYTYRIVESERIGSKIRQRTLLNLGKHFDTPSEHWPLLMARIENIVSGKKDLFEDHLQQFPIKIKIHL